MNKKNALLTTILGAGLAVGASFLVHKNKQRKKVQDTSATPEQELAGRMEEMICRDRFVLAVQPVVDLETGSVVGGEVLSRLNHPDRGVVFPDKFIPALEKAGLYPEFDCYIFQKTCDLVKRLSEQGIQVQYLSCNFSRMTLSGKGIAARLAKIADDHGVAHDQVAVEVTEHEMETDTEQFCLNLQQLKDAGFRIFVDDLGAGVTSVKDLWSYPVDVVKLDRSLLLNAETERGKIAFRGVRNLAADLGCKVLCEGVETEQQHQFVQDAGCQYCQGFLFYRPMEEAKYIHLMGG